MSDKEFMQDILFTSKALAGVYHHATQEAFTPPLQTTFKSNLNDALSMQQSVFSTMQQKGWYPQQTAKQEQINQVKSKYK